MDFDRHVGAGLQPAQSRSSCTSRQKKGVGRGLPHTGPRHFEKTTFGRIWIGQSPVHLVGDLNPTVFARRHDAAIYYHAIYHAVQNLIGFYDPRRLPRSPRLPRNDAGVSFWIDLGLAPPIRAAIPPLHGPSRHSRAGGNLSKRLARALAKRSPPARE